MQLAGTICLLVGLLGATPAFANEQPGDPDVRSLQRAAVRLAEVDSTRVRSWLGRVRKAALLPTLKFRVGRGTGALQTLRDVSGIEHFLDRSSDSWHFDAEAGWSFDRLLFDRNELRLSREAQRVAVRREELVTTVAHLYFARRRLQMAANLDPDASREAILDRAVEIDELSAILEGLTGVPDRKP